MQKRGSIQQKTNDGQPTEERVVGMDSIRFFAALWVAFYHLGFPSTFSLKERISVEEKILGAALDSLFCGPAAVIVFLSFPASASISHTGMEARSWIQAHFYYAVISAS